MKNNIENLTESLEKLTGKKVILKEEVSYTDLKKELWEKGYEEYFDSIQKLNKVLSQYKFVSSLPKDITISKLKTLSSHLSNLADKINVIFLKY